MQVTSKAPAGRRGKKSKAVNLGKVAWGVDIAPSKFRYISKNDTARNLQENALCEGTLVFLFGVPVLKAVQSQEQRSKNRINPLICHYTRANSLIFRASRKSQVFLECTTSPSLTPLLTILSTFILWSCFSWFLDKLQPTEQTQMSKCTPAFCGPWDVLHKLLMRERTGGGSRRAGNALGFLGTGGHCSCTAWLPQRVLSRRSQPSISGHTTSRSVPYLRTASATDSWMRFNV